MPSKITECQVAKLTEDYVKKVLETNRQQEGDTSSIIENKITELNQLLQDLAGKAQYAVNMQQRSLQTQSNVMRALKDQQTALARAKKEEELEKRRIQEEVEKALKLRMIQVEKEERKHLQERIRDERERLQREAEERRR